MPVNKLTGSETNLLRGDALAILHAGVAAADPAEAVRRHLVPRSGAIEIGRGPIGSVDGTSRVLLLAAGKAAGVMAEAAVQKLGGRVGAGVVAVQAGADVERLEATLPAEISVWAAGHPVPDIGSLAAAGEALKLARSAGEGDLVLCLLSGGASAIWTAPAPGLTLADLQASTAALLRSGAPIEVVNTVRKHLSAIAGGRLALAARPARVATLAISDVIGSVMDAIGSGPTLPDPTSYGRALELVHAHEIELPPQALRHLRAGAAGLLPETPVAEELENLLGFEVILSVRDALEGAAAEARRLGYEARIVAADLEGEAREVAGRLAAEVRRARSDAGQRVALLWGGETTVTVRGAGLGGRNQELALAAAVALADEPGVVLGSMGTDGRDGPTDAAGAVVDGGTVMRGVEAGLDATATLHANDAFHYLQATGDLIVTGPSGTNVNDLVVALINPSPSAG